MKQITITIILILITATFLYSEPTLDELANSSIWNKVVVDDVEYYTKNDSGRVPILCFHKIGNEDRYEITSDNFENLLIYIKNNNFFPISDKDYINRDLSKVPTGYKPIILGSDDADKGNFTYKKVGSDLVIAENTMISLLEKHVKPVNGRINFTYYVSFNGTPFRQEGEDIIKRKFNYILDHFYFGIHTVTHPVTKNSSVKDFKWELDEFYKIMYSYVGDKISLINTLAYPYGCADLKPEMQKMISDFQFNGVKIIGAYDFNGYFSHNPYSLKINKYDISRFGVDNKNIQNLYGFLENIEMFKTQRVIVIKDKNQLELIDYNSDDTILVANL